MSILCEHIDMEKGAFGSYNNKPKSINQLRDEYMNSLDSQLPHSSMN